MRTDVKIGAVLGTFLLVIGGWYYLGRDKPAAEIALGGADGSTGGVKITDRSNPQADPGPAVARRDGAPGVVSWDRNPAVTTAPPPQPPPSVGDEKGPRFIDDPPTGVAPANTAHEEVTAAAPAVAPTSELTPAAANLKEILDRQTLTPEEAGATRGTHAASSAIPTGDRPGGTVAAEPGAHAAVSAAGTDAPAAAPSSARTYKVGRGDTLALISEIYYGSQKYTSHLLAANPQITNKEIIRVGTVLNVPPLEELLKLPNPTLNPEPRTLNPEPSYTVKPGDTFYSIAARLLGSGGRWKEIYELNKEQVDSDPASLKVGQVLKLPATKRN
jgi:nucleoid-associated protein YgaU